MKKNVIHLNNAFANCSEEDEIYPLIVKEIAEAPQADAKLKHLFKCNAVLNKGLELLFVENKSCICNKIRLVIPKSLQQHAVMWYHHYLQHPRNTHLKEMIKAAMYWKGMRSNIWSIAKSCKTCQVNKRRTSKYGLLPSKIVKSSPWEALCLDLIGPYTLKVKYDTAIDFMALTMINPISSWFEIMELLLVMKLQTKMVNGKEKIIKEEMFDKSSDCVSQSVNKIWLCRYPIC